MNIADQYYNSLMETTEGMTQPMSPLMPAQGATPDQMSDSDHWNEVLAARKAAAEKAANRARADQWMRQNPGTGAATQYGQAPAVQATPMQGLMSMAMQQPQQQMQPRGQQYVNPVMQSLMGRM